MAGCDLQRHLDVHAFARLFMRPRERRHLFLLRDLSREKSSVLRNDIGNSSHCQYLNQMSFPEKDKTKDKILVLIDYGKGPENRVGLRPIRITGVCQKLTFIYTNIIPEHKEIRGCLNFFFTEMALKHPALVKGKINHTSS